MSAFSNCCPQVYHDGLKADAAAWRGLMFVGVQEIDGVPFLEMRNCECNATLAVAVDDEAEEELLRAA